jgi:hypothetical protein
MTTQKLGASSFTQLRYIPEVDWGVTPATGNAIELRMTGETLDFNLTKDSSKEINSSRQVRSLATTNASAQGAVNIEFSYSEYDFFLAALLGSAWVAYGTSGQSASITATAAIDGTGTGHDTLTASVATAGNDAWTKLKKGDYVRIDPATPADVVGANAGLMLQLDMDGTTTVLSFASGSGLVAMTGKNIKISSQKLKIGNNIGSATIEKNFTDVNQFFSYTGMSPSKLDLSLQTGNFITGSLTFVGKKGNRTDVTALPGVPVASQNYRSMSAVDGVWDVRIGGVPVETKYETYIKELTLSYDNQLEGLMALGYLGAVQLMAKEIQLTGGMQLYLADGSLYDDFVAGVTNSMSFVVKDPDGYGYAFVFDKIDFSSMPVQASGNGQSVVLDAKWTALMGDTSKNSLTIFKL